MISTTFMGEFEDWKEKFETDPDGNTEYTSKEDTELLCQVGQALASKFKVEGNPKEYNTLQEAKHILNIYIMFWGLYIKI